MNCKKVFLTALVSAALSLGTAQANDGAIYEITAVKGKALIQLPGGKRQLAKPGMRVVDGSEIIVLKNSVVNGFDIQNKCEVEYREHVRTALYRGKLCHAAIAHKPSKPAYVSKSYTPKPPPVVAGGSIGVGAGAGFLPLALGGIGLLAIALDDDDPASP